MGKRVSCGKRQLLFWKLQTPYTSECLGCSSRVGIFHIVKVSFLPHNTFCCSVCVWLVPAVISVHLTEHPVGTSLFS